MGYIGEQIEELEVTETPMLPQPVKQPQQEPEKQIGFEPVKREETVPVPTPAGWESV